eukprot:TRINITY_DN19840_c0_g1::TRINITY_DN19840_c0_g1_i1::g.28978::m.28978 TRINITY_DN19840_c0_g1::TRINITY_DN19840_c0_g1_i1::g.28978  ORF type:complete len:190 (-),score=19.94,sp/O76387/PTH2_CAEEL/33.69/4e-22,PTH2/PF01981.11/1.7e-32,UBA/PF00627.26/9.4e-07 TRINITY_DN19840_c0_g1_i1:456-992(-)
MAENLTPNPEFLRQLMDMGFSEEMASMALAQTGNLSFELALEFALNSSVGTYDDDYESDEDLPQYKMVLVVSKELNMSPGKIAAQCCHAALEVFRQISDQPWAKSWEGEGEKMVVLQTPSSSDFVGLCERAKELALAHTVITDAGRTEIESGSQTVFACAGLEETVNQITGKLSLLKQ